MAGYSSRHPTVNIPHNPLHAHRTGLPRLKRREHQRSQVWQVLTAGFPWDNWMFHVDQKYSTISHHPENGKGGTKLWPQMGRFQLAEVKGGQSGNLTNVLVSDTPGTLNHKSQRRALSLCSLVPLKNLNSTTYRPSVVNRSPFFFINASSLRGVGDRALRPLADVSARRNKCRPRLRLSFTPLQPANQEPCGPGGRPHVRA